MKCPKCQAENPDSKKFCRRCGTRFLVVCPQCNSESLPEDQFCGECGQKLMVGEEAERAVPKPEGERKHVTVLFSDLSGYTAMSEKLDPEEVKEITSRIFAEIAQVVTKYEGFVEKFVGDAVMALFGVPKAHEDDPVRAIRVAREIHELVEAISPQFEQRVGKPLSMHTGINTGLVVTGEVDLKKGSHGVAGETVNLASRLSQLAKPGEIMVAPETCHQAEGYFTFEGSEPMTVKGKAEPVQIYKVLSPKEDPRKIHRLHGLRSDLIGRKAEMTQLAETVERLREGKGGIISICGDAGTGKSRLVEEFRATLDLKEIQWREGHAHAYSQNIPYSPLIDLLNRAWQIEEGDPPEKVRHKVESGLEALIGRNPDVIPYIGSLYALSYPEVEGVSPESWKSRLQEAIQTIVSALAQNAPTVICLEDLHWADPSSLDLLRFLLSEFRYPALFLCVYRPPFSLFTSHELSGMGALYHEIRLQDLSSSEAQSMVESLLTTDTIPSELRRFIRERVEGNPFYLEEVINALIESGTLARDDGMWKLARSISGSDVPSTIHGVISARLDRLERETKRILQEASVIGRAFLYAILKKVTELKDQMDRCLSGLERLDLIRAKSLQPDLEYVFKHALTQEVVYNGLLKKERQEIHERIGLVMEELFHDRLSEFSETLAFHFKQGQSLDKAVDYLVRSGEKSLKRYAVEESHQYFREAFDLLSNKPDRTKYEAKLLIDLLIKWAYVFYYRGDFRELENLLNTHLSLAESLDDKARLGMFYGWLGMALYPREKFEDSNRYLRKALTVGEEIGDRQVIGYACTWLTWTCAELGFLDDALAFGEKAQKIAKSFESDHYLYLKSLGGMGHTYCFRGEREKAIKAGRALLEYGQRHSNARSMVMGHYVLGFSHFMDGDFPSAIECSQKGVEVSADPYYSQIPKTLLGISYVSNGQFDEAENILKEVVDFSQRFGTEIIGTLAQASLGVVALAKGRLSRGIRMLEDGRRVLLKNQRRWFSAQYECILGRVYLRMVEGARSVSLSILAREMGFIAKNLPFARKRAEVHYHRATEIAKEIGAKGVLGQAYLDVGVLHKTKGKTDRARRCISEAVDLFEQCQAEIYLKEAKEALEDLG